MEVKGWSQDQVAITDLIAGDLHCHQLADAQGDVSLLQINGPQIQLCVVGCHHAPSFVNSLWAFPWVSVDGREYEREFKCPYFFIRRLLTIQLFSLPCRGVRVC